jgi:uncharacterized protein (TIGR04141 family)
MDEKEFYYQINLFRVIDEYSDLSFEEYLSKDLDYVEYNLNNKLKLDGKLYIKVNHEKKPKWYDLIESLIDTNDIRDIGNKSSSAVLILRVDNTIYALAFGYGRYMLNESYFVTDFGIKTALNTLDHKSLQSIDFHTLDNQPVQKKSQATIKSDASVFGIDIQKDILRAVTGTPKQNVPFRRISGGDQVYSFGCDFDIKDLPNILKSVNNYFNLDEYLEQFSWVDNIRRVKVKDKIEELDNYLIEAIKVESSEVVFTIPEVLQWDKVLGFSFTRNKRSLKAVIESSEYYKYLDNKTVSIEKIKSDKLFIFDIYEIEEKHPIYKCIYFEFKNDNTTNIFFSGKWYEIDNNFKSRVEKSLKNIAISNLAFPTVLVKIQDGKEQIETEAEYNSRVEAILKCYLLDKKLVKTDKKTTAIELCDLFTKNKKLIHVKHRKGGSAGLSHLFSQGTVSAELILGDRAFRIAARRVLKGVNVKAQDLIPLEDIVSSDYEVVYLILGIKKKDLIDDLPFFSKVNLSIAANNLNQRGFKLSIAGVETENL